MRIRTENSVYEFAYRMGELHVRRVESNHEMRRDEEWLKCSLPFEPTVGASLTMILEPLGMGDATIRRTSPVLEVWAMNLPEPECRGGYTYRQLDEILGDRMGDFERWMTGQTMMFCNGIRWNQETESYEDACGGIAHGAVVYSWDLERYLGVSPVID